MTISTTESPGVLRSLRSYRGIRPQIAAGVWIAESALVVGDVALGADSSVWFGAVLRGDVHRIRVGARTNIQDHCVLHVTADEFPCTVGDEVTVGHRAVVHGCVVGDGALIGIGAVVLDGARVGCEAALGAGAVLRPGAEVPDGMLAVGVPARVVRALREDERRLQRERADHYVEVARHYREESSRVR